MTYRNKIQNRNRYKREKDKERIEKREMRNKQGIEKRNRNIGSVPNTG